MNRNLKFADKCNLAFPETEPTHFLIHTKNDRKHETPSIIHDIPTKELSKY